MLENGEKRGNGENRESGSMLEVDGSAGGGQLLRSAIALSVITDTPVRIENVRGAREQPGLKPQHAMAVEAAAAIANATVEGVEPGSETVAFVPEAVAPGRYTVDIGTAGSITLLFETVLPMALAASGRVSVSAIGGTDVTWSPPIDYTTRVKLPVVRRFGLGAAVDVQRRGFYPKGGGSATLSLFPSVLEPIRLSASIDVDAIQHVDVYAVAGAELADAEVGERMARAAVEGLEATGHTVGARVVEYTDTDNPGAVITLRANTCGDEGYDDPGDALHETKADGIENDGSESGGTESGGTETGGGDRPVAHPTAGMSGLGEPGKSAEEVAHEAVSRFEAFTSSFGAVDRHLADQLVLPLAVAGGTLAIPELTDHVASSLELVSAFGLDVECETRAAGGALLRSSGIGDRRSRRY